VCIHAWCVICDSFFISFGVHDTFHEGLILSLSKYVCVCERECVCVYVMCCV